MLDYRDQQKHRRLTRKAVVLTTLFLLLLGGCDFGDLEISDPPPAHRNVSIDWSADGDRLVVGGTRGVRLYTASLEEIAYFEPVVDEVFALEYEAFYCPGSHLIAVVMERDRDKIVLLDDQTLTVRANLRFRGNVIVWNPNCNQLAGAAGNSIWIKDVIARSDGVFVQSVETFRGHTDDVNALAWSPSGQLLASASHNDRTNEIRIWDTATATPLDIWAFPENQWHQSVSVAWNPTGEKLAAVDGSEAIYIWHSTTQTSEVLRITEQTGMTSVKWSPDGEKLLTTTWDGFQVWDASTGQALPSLNLEGVVHKATWSPDGSEIAIAGVRQGDPAIWIWSLETDEFLATTFRG